MVSPPRASSLPPNPIRRGGKITGTSGEPKLQSIPFAILQVTKANHEAHVSAVKMQSVRKELKILGHSCRWIRAKSLRIFPAAARPWSADSISKDHEPK